MKNLMCISSVIALITVVSVCTLSAYAVENSTVAMELEIANEAYAAGRYEEAIGKYRNIIGKYGFSPEVLHNLGNSYSGTKQYGQAILQYLRGLSLAPGNDDLEGSLEMARKSQGLFAHEESLLESFTDLFDMNQWTLAALVCYVGITLSLLCHLIFSWKKGLISICGVLLLLLCMCLFGTVQQYSRWSGAVVVKPGVRLLMSPFPTALSQGILDEGSLVYTEKKHGKYHFVRDEKKRSGWVESASFAQIRASHLTYSLNSAGQ